MTLQRTCDIARRGALRPSSTENGAISRRTFIQEGTSDKCAGVRIIVQNSNKWTKPAPTDSQGREPAMLLAVNLNPGGSRDHGDGGTIMVQPPLSPRFVHTDKRPKIQPGELER